MRVALRQLAGVAMLPADRTALGEWFKRNQVATSWIDGRGGRTEFVSISDLPPDVRLAYLRRDLDTLDVEPGVYDDAAHEAFLALSPERRERAERRAGIARLLVSLGISVPWDDRLGLVREKFGEKGASKPHLKRLLKAVEGIDPINYAPALVDDYKSNRSAEFSEAAWSFFMTIIRDAAPEFPLIQAWRDVRDAGPKHGWSVPSYSTFYRRWTALSEAERLHARRGRKVTVDRLTQPVRRDKTTIRALEWVSLDGRTLDFWVDWGDGKAARPVMLALVDVASNMVLDWELVPSENAAGTVRLINRVCAQYGIFDRLYTDNGAAFAGHLVAGGAAYRFRNGKVKDGVQPLGICSILGIDLKFALPKNAQAKIAERTFATLSRVVDDRPEFANAHAGHNPGASPTDKVRPVAVAMAQAVVRREIARHNREAGRRSEGARGRSYEAVFHAGLAERTIRMPTARQRYLASLIWKPVSVDRNGQVQANGWVYGGPGTMMELLRYHGTGRKILLGRDPDDFSVPAMAFDEDGKLICEGIEPVTCGAYGSVEGIRNAARNRQTARKAVDAAAQANNYLDDAEFAEALAALDMATGHSGDTPEPPRKVVGGRFGAPLSVRDTQADDSSGAIPLEFLKNRKAALAEQRKRGG